MVSLAMFVNDMYACGVPVVVQLRVQSLFEQQFKINDIGVPQRTYRSDM